LAIFIFNTNKFCSRCVDFREDKNLKHIDHSTPCPLWFLPKGKNKKLGGKKKNGKGG